MVIAQHHLIEHVTMREQVLQLLISLCHEEELERKSIPAGVFVKPGKKGTVRKAFKTQPRVQVNRYFLSEGSLA